MPPLRLLAALGLSAVLMAGAAPRPLKVAVFNGLGADPECLSDAVEALKIDAAIHPEVVTAADIVQGCLDRFDALVLPGGGGARQMGNLGGLGQAKVLDFVQTKGRGIVGLCAGAYMLSDTPDYTCFRLGGLEAIDREHDERGNGMVRFSFTPETAAMFPEFKGQTQGFMQYFEGPVLIPAKGGRATPVAVLESDVHLKNDAPANMTNGKAFLAWADAGKGRVFLSVGHPENTPGMRWMVARMVRWTLRQPLVSYGADVVRVTRNRAEVLFDMALKAKERAAFEALFPDVESGRKNAAIAALVEMRSWGAKERLEGCLRDRDASVRLTAAEALVELEHTAALRDVKAAAATERDPATRKGLARCVRALSAMTHGR